MKLKLWIAAAAMVLTSAFTTANAQSVAVQTPRGSVYVDGGGQRGYNHQGYNDRRGYRDDGYRDRGHRGRNWNRGHARYRHHHGYAHGRGYAYGHRPHRPSRRCW
ncbi:MAG TPA: hypothetical protein VL098_15270 [Flavipsychrobacter sp.]|nr:hypothetical protein [Flavipsychrobacter sp.]